MEGFEKIACDFCRSQAHRTLFNICESANPRLPPKWRGDRKIPVVQCIVCELVFLNPRYNQDQLRTLYQDPDIFHQSVDPDGETRHLVAERIERIGRFIPDVQMLAKYQIGGKLLDVGSGLGFFLEALPDTYKTVGLDWSHPVTQMVRAPRWKMVESQFPNHPFNAGEFDIVTFHNVLDHLPSPLHALETTRTLLKSGGILMLKLVNFGGMASKIYGPGFRLLGPNHLYYFTPRTIRRYLERTGFNILKIDYPYFGTDFAKPYEHLLKVTIDWWAFRIQKKPQVRISPPFYGNIMRVFAVKST